jgi:aarF domain-containing kinase
MVAAVDAMSREALGEALRMTLSSNAAITALRSVEALGPLRSMVLPMPLPLDFLASMGTRMTLTSEDRQALDTISLLLDMLGSQPPHTNRHVHPDFASGVFDSMDSTLRTGTVVVRGASDLVPIMPELLCGVQATVELFVRHLLRRWALRFADDLDSAAWQRRET